MSDSEDNDNDYQDDQIENGHLPDENQGQSFNSAVDLDQFDIDLPTTHRYLGKLKNVGGYTFYTDGEIVTLAARQTNTLVFPGFTLPLVINNDLEINTLQRHTRKNNSFVLLSPNENFQGVFDYGTIMEIIENHLRDSVLYIKARSRQCCRLVEPIKSLIGDVYEVTVRALLESAVPSPIHDTQLLSLRHRRPLTTLTKLRKFHLSQFSAPSWILNCYELDHLAKQLVGHLRRFYLVEFIPEDDPVRLSYWFVQNFQLKHSERLAILKMTSVTQRLRYEIRLVKLKRLICCVKCDAEIAKQSNVFPMSKDGVQSNYCNPQGYVFETVTVSKAINFNLIGAPSMQFSWFPGYAWTIMQCKMCGSHLGWKFSSHNLKPESFFGLAKNGFNVNIIRDASGGDDESSDL